MLEIKYRLTSELIGYVNNSRTHSEEQVSQISASIKEFGFTNPLLLDEGSGIIAGHGRLLAAKKLSMDEVPTITLIGLTDIQRKAYVIADNKLALNAGWDENLLVSEFKDIHALDFNFDLSIIGFDDAEISKLFDETGGVVIDDAIEDLLFDSISVKFLPCDRTDIMNAINLAIACFNDAHLLCVDDE